MALIHSVVIIAIKCWSGQSLISAWSLKGNLVPQSKEWKIYKESVTIWPVYAYTLAAQNTVIKLLMLILYAEDNTSMSYEDTHA